MFKAIVLVPFLLWAATVEARELRSSDVYGRDSPTVQAVAYMDKLIRERTFGRHSIAMLGENDSDTESYTIGQVRNGSLDMARINLAVFNSAVASTVIPSLPYLFKSKAHMRGVLDGPIGEQILADLQAQGFVGLCFYDGGARSFYSAKTPIKKAADVKGMTVRVQQGDVTALMIRALGATPMVMSFPKALEGFRVGLLDAAVNNMQLYSTSGHFKLAKYYSQTEHSMAPGVLVFSKQIWDTFSSEDQAAIRSAAKDSVPYMRKLFDQAEESTRRDLKASGVEILGDIDKKSFATAFVPLHASLVPDPGLQNVVASIQTRD